jgi:hypothetical protein
VLRRWEADAPWARLRLVAAAWGPGGSLFLLTAARVLYWVQLEATRRQRREEEEEEEKEEEQQQVEEEHEEEKVEQEEKEEEEQQHQEEQQPDEHSQQDDQRRHSSSSSGDEGDSESSGSGETVPAPAEEIAPCSSDDGSERESPVRASSSADDEPAPSEPPPSSPAPSEAGSHSTSGSYEFSDVDHRGAWVSFEKCSLKVGGSGGGHSQRLGRCGGRLSPHLPLACRNDRTQIP